MRLPHKHKLAISTDLAVLCNMGPMLGRPYVDQIKGSKYKNLKELRTQISGHVYRTACLPLTLKGRLLF